MGTLKAPTIALMAWILGAFVPFLIRDPFFLHISNVIFLGIAMTLSWGILARTGYISFAHNAFLGIGAYTSVYFIMQMKVPFWAGFLGAGAMAGLFAVVLGVVILRLKGIFFVLSTFCFAQIMLRVFRIAVSITGGANGIRDIPPPAFPVIGMIHSHEGFYILFYIYATLVVLFTYRLYRCNLGREFKAIAEDIFAAESMGIYTTRRKIVAFVISSIIVGFSGSLHAHYTFFISDTTFEMVKAIEVVIYNVVGGMGSIVGPIIGVAVMVPIPEFLRGFVAYQIALYGLILILILRFFPAGIWGTAKKIGRLLITRERPLDSEPLRLSSELVAGFSSDFYRTAHPPKGVLLQCCEVSRYFGGLAALSDVSFSIRQGEILGIVGPNGAGKTTLFNVITGVFSPSKGTVLFEEKNVAGLQSSVINRHGISRVFQATVLYSEATVRENIARALVARSGFSDLRDFLGLDRTKHQWMDEQSQLVLRLCGLDGVAGELAKNLPYGFQRLLGLAMALAARPRLLLLDEPVAGMSLEEMSIIGDILLRLHQNGMTMIIVEHNVNFIMRLCPRIMVLNYGQKIVEGTPAEIRTNPKVIEAFLGG